MQSFEVPLFQVHDREDLGLLRANSLKKSKGHFAWRVEFGALGLWSYLEALKMMNNNPPPPWAPEKHHQKAEFEGIFTKCTEYLSPIEAHQPDDDRKAEGAGGKAPFGMMLHFISISR